MKFERIELAPSTKDKGRSCVQRPIEEEIIYTP
jgi:hypothetical protein